MLSQKKIIEDGDRVVIYAGKDKMQVVTIDAKSGEYCSKFGNYKHKNLIGKEIGTKIQSDNNNGFVHVLSLTSELWSIALDHRTQILFNLDISTIIFNLELKNGSKVVESGTGSGSLSSSIARTIAPNGHLYTFEFHEERAEAARKDFRDNRIDKHITVTHRDACKQGFRLDHIEGMVGSIDAVFLDLPSPWEAIDHAIAVMHEGAMLCSFSPCIEQVQNTCLKLAASQFQEITTIEVLIRTFDTRLQEFEELNLSNPYTSTTTTTPPTTETNTTTSTSEPKAKKKWNQNKRETFEIGGIQGLKKDSLLSKPISEARGHTGYLTFARWVPEN
ncbi:hypothetical protein CYY_004964 [Polysphondylium violaceum]|uniref:tRNA (adenine(58)-N(1))-methyltransferase n=1 Tax=Polysphondylium violaceum TaxID=133409 RepID=A0A8J4PUJ1_9MYCE|nr:hypothetical protein CYY_004964 [Polysphondylium violaceum]